MPSLHYLNPAPHPFWDFVASLEDHPSLTTNADPQVNSNCESSREGGPHAATTTGQPEAASAQDRPTRQPTVEDEDETQEHPAPKRGIGRSNHHDKHDVRDEHGPQVSERDMPFRGRGGCNSGRGGHRHYGREHAHRGPPGFPFGPFGAPVVPPHGGPPRPWFAYPGHHPHAHGPYSPPEGRGRGCGRRAGRHHHDASARFNVGSFLNHLGNSLGLDLSGAAEGLGLDRFTSDSGNGDTDFEPRIDVFDTPTSYVAHLSLPGAKKQDVGVDWDGEHSALRIAGVAYRPHVDETMMSMLAVDGRKREVGVFEKIIKLGTRHEPASVDVSGITAKMQDGVLIVTVPKLEKENEKREVPINSPDASPPRNESSVRVNGEDAVMEDRNENEVIDAGVDRRSETEKGDEDMHEEEPTVEPKEQLPAYNVTEKGGSTSSEESEDEGEYVKIDVD
ncbi:MAG: hypothetical protein Q9227_007368 [Pyrenula ochraceoflavens]